MSLSKATNRFVFMPCFSITPNQISSFNKIFYRDTKNQTLKSPQDFRKNRTVKFKESTSENKITKAFHGFELSDNAYRTLKKKISWLYYMAKPRHVKTYSGKDIYNFKCAFLTFTLPAEQREPTKEFTNMYFNQLLTELRTRLKMQNYVWRLEFQANGNVHYHLVTDTYCDYFFLQKVWNRILSKGHYIDTYADKFKNLSLSQYNDLTNPDRKTEFGTIAKRYAKGKKTAWRNPPSVDVKSVIASQSISNYLAKYFAKDSDNNPIKNKLDNAENSKSMRLWFCSRGLSKLVSVSGFCEAVDFSATALVEGVKKVRKVVFRYATVFYFQAHQLPNFIKRELAIILKNYAFLQGYSPAT